jgi:hypothetical protein
MATVGEMEDAGDLFVPKSLLRRCPNLRLSSNIRDTHCYFFSCVGQSARTHAHTHNTHAHTHTHNTHIHTRTRTHTYTHAHAHIHTYTHTHTHSHTHTHRHTHTHMHGAQPYAALPPRHPTCALVPHTLSSPFCRVGPPVPPRMCGVPPCPLRTWQHQVPNPPSLTPPHPTPLKRIPNSFCLCACQSLGVGPAAGRYDHDKCAGGPGALVNTTPVPALPRVSPGSGSVHVRVRRSCVPNECCSQQGESSGGFRAVAVAVWVMVGCSHDSASACALH